MTKEYGLVTSSSWRLGPALKEVYPEIEDYTRIWPWNRSLVKYKDKMFDESEFWLSDPAFFKIFSFQFIRGTPESALQHKYSLVLTEETARRYFGDENPIGKTVFVRRHEHDFIVCGVIKNPPSNSSFRFDLMGRVDLMTRQRLESWEYTGYTMVLLTEKISSGKVEQKIWPFYKKYVDSESEAYPVLQPLTKLHLYENGHPGLIKQVYLFSIIAIFILLIACINFMNLSTARATKRAVEVGIRKTVGAYKKELLFQFFGESILISIVSLFIGTLIVELFIPLFNMLTNKQLALFPGDISNIAMFLTGSILFTGIISGSYPALYMSSLHPVHILRGKSIYGERGKTFRRVLTIFQFTISIGLIICVFTVQKQLSFIVNKDIGFQRDSILNILDNQDLIAQFDSYRHELLKNQHIESVTSAASTPFNIGTFININWQGHMDQESVSMPYNMVEYDFFKTFNMEFIAGRTFSRQITSDEREACIINESAARLMGFKQTIGKEVYFNHPAFEESFKKVKVIGVVKDFHSYSLHKEIAPSIFRMYKPWQSYIYINISPEEVSSTLNYVEQITRKFAPEYPFRYEFLDQTYWRLYQTELRMSRIINYFAVIAIFISCLGLFGLTSYTVETRTIEIGIRKVLGASVSGVTLMLSKEFLKWIILSNIFAWPLAWFFMRQWLANFAYRTEMSWWIFIFAGLAGLILALMTVIFQSVKAALMNPVEALRYE